MSQNHGARLLRPSTSDKPARLGLDRPSLFNDINQQDGTRDGDAQRVGILSTLASSRQAKRSKSPMKLQDFSPNKRRDWQTAGLIALMGMGIVTLLASFVMVIEDGRHDLAKQQQAVTQVALTGTSLKDEANADNPLGALIVPKPDTSAEQVEAVRQPQQANTNQAARKVAVVSKKLSHAPAIKGAAAISAGSSSMQVTRAPPVKTKDDDVALLEAMFVHTRPRQLTLSVGEALKQRCAVLRGADAETCRTRVCVQYPTDNACHEE